MQLICENPYRILGLSITATDREIAKRVSDISVYIEMGKAVNYNYDFVDFAPLERNIESVRDAERKLEQPKDKLLHSMFWISFDDNDNSLKNLNTINQFEIINNITDNNAFDLHNKAIITLFSKKDFKTIKAGINYFNEFLAHVSYNNFINKIVGEKLSITYNAAEIFYEELLKEIIKIYKPKEILDLFKNTPKEDFIISITIKPIIYKIESEIESTKAYTTKDPESAYKFGRELINNTSENLKNIKSILPENDLMFTSISNKVAEQILDCSIAYFNKNFESTEMNIGSNAIELTETAKQIAKSSIIIERIEKNIHNMQDWIDNQPRRDTINKVKTEFDQINSEIIKVGRELSNKSQPSDIAKSDGFLDVCEPILENICDKIGSDNLLYAELSSIIATICISHAIEWYNAQGTSPSPFQYEQRGATLSDTKRVYRLFKRVKYLKMDNSTASYFEKNFSVIKQNKNTQGGGGCYIATMVYGNCNSQEVILLRKFRDDKLSKTLIGKCFINFYYKYSPNFVRKFKSNRLVNKIVKKVLDKLIGVLK